MCYFVSAFLNLEEFEARYAVLGPRSGLNNVWSCRTRGLAWYGFSLNIFVS
jgi:hypothetical protein